jgi:hypothetical protein
MNIDAEKNVIAKPMVIDLEIRFTGSTNGAAEGSRKRIEKPLIYVT